MYFQIYIDTLFLVNLIMNYLVMLLVSKLVRCTATHFSLFLGAAFGAFMFCILIILPMIPVYLKSIIAYGGISLGMIRIGFKTKEVKVLCGGSIYLFVCLFLFSGCLQWMTKQIPYLRQVKSNILLVLIGGYICFLGSSYLLKKYEEKKAQLYYDVEFEILGKKINVMGILDTGNGLVEPLTQRPVSLLNESILKEYIEQGYQKGFCAIPFHSIGKNNGIIYGYEIEEVRIKTRDAEIKKQKIIVAIVEGEVSSGKSYQMILHPDLFTN